MAAAQAPKKQAPWKGFVAGSTGAMLSGAVTHPIDLVKVRMQLYGAQDGFQAASVSQKSALSKRQALLRRDSMNAQRVRKKCTRGLSDNRTRSRELVRDD